MTKISLCNIACQSLTLHATLKQKVLILSFLIDKTCGLEDRFIKHVVWKAGIIKHVVWRAGMRFGGQAL